MEKFGHTGNILPSEQAEENEDLFVYYLKTVVEVDHLMENIQVYLKVDIYS